MSTVMKQKLWKSFDFYLYNICIVYMEKQEQVAETEVATGRISLFRISI